ncbi:MAG: prepilin peptidase [Candidatus Nealsonbacteria bacterium]|nr:prepilin peptidase [Candidatus Nealsonbacteria bacterium]
MLSFFQPPFFEPFFYPLFFFFGLAVGSFLNCLIYRLEKNEALFWGRSYCPNCRYVLSWQDLIPLFSFFLLKGKCRYCRQKISWQYPLVEISTAAIFLLIFNFFTPLDNFVSNGARFSIFNFLNLIYYWLIASFLIVIFVYDLKHYIIPDRIIYSAIGIALIFNFQFLIFNQFSIFKFSILSGLGAAIFFLTIVLISGGKWMGIGDIKLAFLMGLILGWPNILVALFLAFLLGAFIGAILLISRKKTLKSEIPFGPFLVSGTFISIFFGPQIISFYLNLFLI